MLGITIGIVTFVLVATGAFVELQDDWNLIWKAKPSEGSGVVFFIKSRVASLALLVAIGFLLLVPLTVDAALSAVGNYLNEALPLAAILLQAFNFVLALSVATFVFGAEFTKAYSERHGSRAKRDGRRFD